MIDDNAKRAMVATRSFHLHGEPNDYDAFLKKLDVMTTVELDAELRSLGLEPEEAVAVVKKAINDALADLAEDKPNHEGTH